MRYSFVIPIYNRPEGLRRLLNSFLSYGPQTDRDYEIIVVEDGSTQTSETDCTTYSDRLPLRYLALKENQGPAAARNLGSQKASGRYLVFIDTDTTLTPDYISSLESFTQKNIAFGGGTEDLPPDSSLLQRAIHYSMSAWLSTGGIRGHRRAMEAFKPRTHNMILRTSLFRQIGGFRPSLRYGEDIDLSLRIEKHGTQGQLCPQLKVFHYRKNTLSAFFKQVYHSGAARVQLEMLHPGSTRLVHFFPAIFLVGTLMAVLLTGVGRYEALLLLLSYLMALAIEVIYSARSLITGLAAAGVGCVQFFGYGMGFLVARIRPAKTSAA